jgi:Spy/CpxP family protein refolding chaperone
MKAKYLIPALLLLCGTLLASAIAGPHGHFGKLEGLDLSDEQKTKLQALHEARREKMQTLHESGERPSRENRQALLEQFREDLAGILTPDQLALLEDHRANRPERGHRGKRGGKGRFGRGFGGAGLDLSEAQKEQAKALRQAQHEKMHALRESGERPSRETMQALRAEFRASFESILTPEQLEKLAARKAEREAGGSTTSSSTLQVAPTSDAPATAVEEKTWGKVKKDVKE